MPIVGIAGITPKNYQQVLAAGADGAAVVSGILGADNITETVAAFLTGI
ncbi:MAG: thiamine phosphate synthase [Succiniclasticum sp.]|nr:thiamine phosphate synthase [Succiniclasticum sp.]